MRHSAEISSKPVPNKKPIRPASHDTIENTPMASPLAGIHSNKTLQRFLGLMFGIVFGFFLQRGGVANCDVILGQLLMTDFTVVKVMLSAVLVGIVIVNVFIDKGWVTLQPKPGGWGIIVPGGLIFGMGFAILGYCPGTLAAAVGQGSLDALVSGLTGILTGAWLFAVLYPKLKRILDLGKWQVKTLPELLNVSRWTVIFAMALSLSLVLLALEIFGL